MVIEPRAIDISRGVYLHICSCHRRILANREVVRTNTIVEWRRWTIEDQANQPKQ